MLPMSFEANWGQVDSQVRYISRSHGYTLSLTNSEAVMEMRNAGYGMQSRNALVEARNSNQQQPVTRNPQFETVRMKLEGANPQPLITGLEQLPGTINYLIGEDPKRWKTDVPTYARVKYEAVYPGIDLVYYGNQRQLEYDFIVAPHADPKQIRISFPGARKLRLDINGDLIIETNAGVMQQRKPLVYQMVNGIKQKIESSYSIENRTDVVFKLGLFDQNRQLVIDPVLSYSTYLGGNHVDIAESIAVDVPGNVYVTGWTVLRGGIPTNFPTTAGSPRVEHPANQAEGTYIFVTKFDPTGTTAVYSAIIGGNQGFPDQRNPAGTSSPENRSRGIAVDKAGNTYLTGQTNTVNFPITPGAIQTQRQNTQGKYEAFVLKLNSTGSALIYSTLLGRGETSGQSIDIDNQGQAWVTGSTSSRLFPVTPNAFQLTQRNLSSSAFVAKLNETGTQLLYSTFLSSGSGDLGLSIAVDPNDNAYTTGWTGSSCVSPSSPPVEPFPTTEGAYRRDPGVGCVGAGLSSYTYVTKFHSTGAILYSTLIGISRGSNIAVDGVGNAYVTGKTSKGLDFPTTPGAFQTSIEGAPFTQAGFVTKLNANGSGLVYSTFLNGATGNPDRSPAIAVDSTGNAYVTGTVSANSYVTTTKESPFNFSSGAYLLKLGAAGSALVYSVVLGGPDTHSQGIALDAIGSAYIAGYTKSDKFPVTPNAFQQQLGNPPDIAQDAFVTKISETNLPRYVSNVSAASYIGTSLASDSIISAFGTGLATTTLFAESNPLPTNLAGTTVKVTDTLGVAREAPLYFVSPMQVNYLMPPETANGVAFINITIGDSVVSSGIVQIETVAPGLYTADSSGRGLPSAFAFRVKSNGVGTFEPIAQDAGQGRYLPIPIDLGQDLGSATDQVFLILYGTGVRHHSGLSAVTVQIGGVDAQVIYAGAQGESIGLDQVNVRIPRSLAGRGEVEIKLVVDGKTANTVQVWIK